MAEATFWMEFPKRPYRNSFIRTGIYIVCQIFCILSLLFFSDERKGEPQVFWSLLGGPVVPSWEEKGYNFFLLSNRKWRLLLCLFCLLHSQDCLLYYVCKSPAGGFHYLSSKCGLPCFPPLFPFFLQVSSFSFHWDVSLKKEKVVCSFKRISHSNQREINKLRGRRWIEKVTTRNAAIVGEKKRERIVDSVKQSKAENWKTSIQKCNKSDIPFRLSISYSQFLYTISFSWCAVWSISSHGKNRVFQTQEPN